jgi:hypothetical protein
MEKVTLKMLQNLGFVIFTKGWYLFAKKGTFEIDISYINDEGFTHESLNSRKSTISELETLYFEQTGLILTKLK